MKSFFREMVEIERQIFSDDRAYSSLSKTVFIQLIELLESDKLTKSKSLLYVCNRWRMNDQELYQHWKDTEVSIKEKSTFRTQQHVMSKQLYGIFGSNFKDCFINDDEVELRAIKRKLDLLSSPSERFSDIFCESVDRFCKPYSEEVYSVEDMTKELDVLKPFTRENIANVFDELDEKKLGYIKKVLNETLIGVRNRTLNVEKLELLKELCSDDGEVDLPKLIETCGAGAGAEATMTEPVVIYKEREPLPNKYGLISPDRLIELLEKRAAETDNSVPPSDKDRVLLERIVELHKESKLEQILQRIHPCEVVAVLGGLNSKVSTQ